jgi:hypothetical protein
VVFVGNYTIVSYQCVCLLNFFGGVSAMSLPVLFVGGFDSVSKVLVLILCQRNDGNESVSIWLCINVVGSKSIGCGDGVGGGNDSGLDSLFSTMQLACIFPAP